MGEWVRLIDRKPEEGQTAIVRGVGLDKRGDCIEIVERWNKKQHMTWKPPFTHMWVGALDFDLAIKKWNDDHA